MKLRPTLLATVLMGIALPVFVSAVLAQDEKTSPSTAPSPVLPPGTTVNTGTGASSATLSSSPVAAPAGMPNEAEMMKQMMEMAKPNENHKLLGSLDGTWNFKVK